MTVVQSAEKNLPARVRPLVRAFAAVLSADGPTARAQRMALIAFAIRVASAGIAFLSQIVQARLMGEFEYGIFVFVWVLVVLFGNLSCLGFHTAIIRFLPRYDGDAERAEIRGLTATARIFALTSATTLALVGFLFLKLLGNSIEPYYVLPLFLALFALPMIALGDVLDGTARASNWPISAFVNTYIIRPTLILAFMLLAVSFGAPKTAVTAMQAALAAAYVTTILQFVIITWRLRKRYDRGPLKIDFMGWFRVALPIFLIEGFGFLLTNSDVVVVGFYLEPDSVAIYFAAAKTMALVQFVYFAVKAAAAPRFSALMRENNHGELKAFAATASRWSFWPSLAVGLLVLAAGQPLLSLFGPAFGAGHVLMAILFVGSMTKALVGPGETLLTMAGKQMLCVWLYCTALTVNILLNITLIPLLGLTGAALATASATMVEALLLHVAVRRSLGITLFALSGSTLFMTPKKTA